MIIAFCFLTHFLPEKLFLHLTCHSDILANAPKALSLIQRQSFGFKRQAIVSLTDFDTKSRLKPCLVHNFQGTGRRLRKILLVEVSFNDGKLNGQQ